MNIRRKFKLEQRSRPRYTCHVNVARFLTLCFYRITLPATPLRFRVLLLITFTSMQPVCNVLHK